MVQALRNLACIDSDDRPGTRGMRLADRDLVRYPRARTLLEPFPADAELFQEVAYYAQMLL